MAKNQRRQEMSTNKDYIDPAAGQERRFVEHIVTHETREENGVELHEISGYAAMFNKETKIGSYMREVVLPGAFDEVMADDVRCLFNHDPNLILARSKNGEGTLKLELDSVGLKYTYTTPNRGYALDLQDAIIAGDVSQSSFAFMVKEQAWEYTEDDGPDLRKIIKFSRLFDVSPVTYPAYNDTTVAKRSYSKPEKAPKGLSIEQKLNFKKSQIHY